MKFSVNPHLKKNSLLPVPHDAHIRSRHTEKVVVPYNMCCLFLFLIFLWCSLFILVSSSLKEKYFLFVPYLISYSWFINVSSGFSLAIFLSGYFVGVARFTFMKPGIGSLESCSLLPVVLHEKYICDVLFYTWILYLCHIDLIAFVSFPRRRSHRVK